MRRPRYAYTGIFLSELAAVGRTSIGVSCAACIRSGNYRLAALIEAHGDVVLPHLLALISADCPRRRSASVVPGCAAVYSDPVTVEEEEAIGAGRG